MRYRARRLRTSLVSVMGIVSAVTLATCDGGSSRARTEHRGDTVFVFANGPPQLPTRIARLDLKIGALEGDPNLSFGRLEELAFLPSGGFVVYDNHFMRLSRFDASGQFLGELGSRGQGPGEYHAVMGLAASSEGLVYVQTLDRRILRFEEDGDYLDEWRPRYRTAVGNVFSPMANSLLALKIIEEPGSLTEPTVYGFVTVDAKWEMRDSTGPVASPWGQEITRGQPSLTSRPFVAWSPAGFHVTGVTGRFAWEVRRAEGGVVRVEREVEPVPFLREEWRDWEEQNEFLRRRAGDPSRYPPTPEHKPPIRAVFLPTSGEIWIQRSTRSVGPDPGHIKMVAGLRATPEWLEPILFEVFAPDGSYLGAVEGPSGIDVRAVSGNSIWGYTNGEYGEQYVVRLRIEAPAM